MMYGLSFFVVLTLRGLVHTGQGNIRVPFKGDIRFLQTATKGALCPSFTFHGKGEFRFDLKAGTRRRQSLVLTFPIIPHRLAGIFPKI